MLHNDYFAIPQKAAMGKLADLASVTTASLNTFVYVPPDSALRAGRVLVLANLGYATGSAPALNWGTLAAVLRGLRRASPQARVLITDRVCPSSTAEALFARSGLDQALDQEMRAAPADALLGRVYDNPLPQPIHHATLPAPEALADFDSVIMVGVFDPTRQPTVGLVSLLTHLLPCDFELAADTTPQRYHDLFFTLAPYVNALVLEVALPRADTRVLTGTNLLAVEQAACTLTKTAPADYLEALQQTARLTAT